MLSIVATPIGNLKDITFRAVETLKRVDAIICEDTRVTGNLLKQLDIPKKQLISFHSHTPTQKITSILQRLTRGEHLALVSDAGTPCISDPGFALVSRIHELNSENSSIKTEVIPGPSAFLAALSVSGLPIHHFRYLGFLPQKKRRRALLESFCSAEETIVFYESVHRIERTLKELAEVMKNQPNRQIVVARELTKMHEEVISTKVMDLSRIADSITKKGEFVIVIAPRIPQSKNPNGSTCAPC